MPEKILRNAVPVAVILRNFRNGVPAHLVTKIPLVIIICRYDYESFVAV
jgi:hypothetical protein